MALKPRGLTQDTIHISTCLTAGRGGAEGGVRGYRTLSPSHVTCMLDSWSWNWVEWKVGSEGNSSSSQSKCRGNKEKLMPNEPAALGCKMGGAAVGKGSSAIETLYRIHTW